MATAANRVEALRWRPRTRMWGMLAVAVAGTLGFGAIGEWRDGHALLINTTDSLPNWAFLIQRHKLPARGDYVFFDPPPGELLRRHFGAKPQMFGADEALHTLRRAADSWRHRTGAGRMLFRGDASQGRLRQPVRPHRVRVP